MRIVLGRSARCNATPSFDEERGFHAFLLVFGQRAEQRVGARAACSIAVADAFSAGASGNEPAAGPSRGRTLRLCSSWPLLTNSKITLPAGTLVRESVKLYSTAVTCTCGTDGGAAGEVTSPGPARGGLRGPGGAAAGGADRLRQPAAGAWARRVGAGRGREAGALPVEVRRRWRQRRGAPRGCAPGSCPACARATCARAQARAGAPAHRARPAPAVAIRPQREEPAEQDTGDAADSRHQTISWGIGPYGLGPCRPVPAPGITGPLRSGATARAAPRTSRGSPRC